MRALLADQHPDLAGRALSAAAAGWDNDLWRLGDDLAVRLPRRAEAARLAANEHRWLPGLAPRLPLAVPAPVRIGRPTPRFPWPWSVRPWLAGNPADVTPVIDGAAGALSLAGFLAALHQPAPAAAPSNPFRGGPLAGRAAAFEERLSTLGRHVDGPGLRPVWERALAAEAWSGAPVWLHADLHPANVVVAGGALAGVIDFGDMCAGDPATDLAAAWMLLPAGAMAGFATAYGASNTAYGAGNTAYAAEDGALWARAAGWAALFGLMLVAIGLAGRPSYGAAGRATLSRLVDTGGRLA